jgi:hypothetical protein
VPQRTASLIMPMKKKNIVTLSKTPASSISRLQAHFHDSMKLWITLLTTAQGNPKMLENLLDFVSTQNLKPS